jgi:predicted metal-dependent enzyme (double-stranded beta helix superfamily)
VFDVERFIAECEHAATEGGQAAVREVLAAAIADPAQIIAALGEPRRAGPQFLHRSPRLTIMNIVWPPSYTQTPHNHLLWAEIGVYTGREDNIFWRRSGSGSKWPIEVAGAASLCAGSRCSFDFDVIHSVTNPLDKVTAGIHVYGGDLSLPPRSAWDGDTLTEAPLSHARDIRAIEAYNATLTD